MKADPIHAEAAFDDPPAPQGILARLKHFGRMIVQRGSSSLTRRIVVLNLAGLVALLVGFLYLNQFREGLIEARVQSLLTQGEIIAGAIAGSATVETNTITIDPDQLLQMQAGETERFTDESFSSLEFSINPERVAPLLRRLVTPTKTRARIFDRDGLLLLDSRSFYSRGDILRMELPPVANVEDTTSFIERTWNSIRKMFRRTRRPVLEEVGPANGKSLPEVQQAFAGQQSSVVRVNNRGETIVSVAVPVQRFRTVQGALLLSTQEGDIDAIIASERFALLQVFLVAAVVMIVLSLFLAGAIAGPVRRLAEAAERVRWGTKSRQEIPDFTNRTDEIGHLSGALRDMTQALYRRLDAIESFAADVSHELKNPLTSLRSAVETLPLAKTDESRNRLMQIIQHDLERIFERFYTDRPEQGFGQNSGLGLSISRQIIQAHHGTIRAENRPGPADEEGQPTVRGARFIVRLPVAPRSDRYGGDDLAA